MCFLLAIPPLRPNCRSGVIDECPSGALDPCHYVGELEEQPDEAAVEDKQQHDEQPIGVGVEPLNGDPATVSVGVARE